MKRTLFNLLISGALIQAAPVDGLYRGRIADPDGIRSHIESLLTDRYGRPVEAGVLSLSTRSQYAIILSPVSSGELKVSYLWAKEPPWLFKDQANGYRGIELLHDIEIGKSERVLSKPLGNNILRLWYKSLQTAREGPPPLVARDGITYEFFAYPLSAQTIEPDGGIVSALADLTLALKDYVHSGDEGKVIEQVKKLEKELRATASPLPK